MASALNRFHPIPGSPTEIAGVAQPLLKSYSDMDFLLACPSCRGAILAHKSLRGARVNCPHCDCNIEVRLGQPVTEALVDRFLSAPTTGVPAGPLRRLRPLPASPPQSVFSIPPLQRQARISHRR